MIRWSCFSSRASFSSTCSRNRSDTSQCRLLTTTSTTDLLCSTTKVRSTRRRAAIGTFGVCHPRVLTSREPERSAMMRVAAGPGHSVKIGGPGCAPCTDASRGLRKAVGPARGGAVTRLGAEAVARWPRRSPPRAPGDRTPRARAGPRARSHRWSARRRRPRSETGTPLRASAARGRCAHAHRAGQVGGPLRRRRGPAWSAPAPRCSRSWPTRTACRSPRSATSRRPRRPGASGRGPARAPPRPRRHRAPAP